MSSEEICIKFSREQLDAFKRMLINGIPEAVLDELGIRAGSMEAEDLENTIFDIVRRCCAEFVGEGPGRSADQLPGPDEEADLDGAVLATGAVLVYGSPTAGSAALAELLALLRRFGRVLLRLFRRHPLLAVLTLGLTGGISAERLIFCELVRTRIISSIEKECMYNCDGHLVYVRISGPLTLCAPGLILPL